MANSDFGKSEELATKTQVISQSDINNLKLDAESSPLRRARICLHNNLADPIHEMVIAFKLDSYVPPHIHMDKTESFHVMEGELVVVFFDEYGQVIERLNLSSDISKHPSIYRLSKPVWHTILPLSSDVVIHEVTNGPFIPDEKNLAPWAPAQDASDQAKISYRRSILS